MQDIRGVRSARPDAPPDARPLGAFREADTVVTLVPVQCEGRTLPQGSEGTIIDVSPVEGHYGIEFMAPFHCVVFLDATDIR